MVADRRADREAQVDEGGRDPEGAELDKVDIPAEISGRAKHFYSIYDKMAKKGREFNEIYDLTAMRVIVERAGDEGTRDCYGALGLIHSLWKPMPGRFKDFVAMPKFNRYRVAAHDRDRAGGRRRSRSRCGRARCTRRRSTGSPRTGSTRAARAARPTRSGSRGCKPLLDWQQDEADPREFMKTFRTDLFDDEVYVFTPKGEVKTLPAGRDADRLRLRRAHRRRPQDGRREDQRPDRPAPLPAQERRLRRDPHLEVGPRPVARLDVARGVLARPQQDPAVVLARDARRDRAEGPRGPRAGAEGAEPAVPEAAGLGGARAGDPRDRASRRPRTSTSRSAPASSGPARSSTR